MTNNQTIHSVAIYPPLGIARIGNSSEYYLASDVPGIVDKPIGGYKDAMGKVKKQVARFRVYGFKENGEVIREITAQEATLLCNITINKSGAEPTLKNEAVLKSLTSKKN